MILLWKKPSLISRINLWNLKPLEEVEKKMIDRNLFLESLFFCTLVKRFNICTGKNHQLLSYQSLDAGHHIRHCSVAWTLDGAAPTPDRHKKESFMFFSESRKFQHGVQPVALVPRQLEHPDMVRVTPTNYLRSVRLINDTARFTNHWSQTRSSVPINCSGHRKSKERLSQKNERKWKGVLSETSEWVTPTCRAPSVLKPQSLRWRLRALSDKSV